MTIEFTELHNELHAYRDGSVPIEVPFEGNLLAISVTTKPEYLLSRQIIGTLYQVYGSTSKGYSVYSGKDIIRLDLPQTEKLWFSPTSFLSDSYALNLSYALAGVYGSESGATPLPEQILGLPVRVSDAEDNIGSIETTLDALGLVDTDLSNRLTALEETTSSPSWDSVTDKPSTFPPSEHSHAISDVTGLMDALTDLESPSWTDIADKPMVYPADSHYHFIANIDGLEASLTSINSELTDIDSRVETLEASTSSGATVNASAETSLVLDGTLTITGKEILKVYKKVPLLGSNLIPTMTSNTAPSPLVASSNGSAAGSPFNAFDKVLTDRGWLADSQTGKYVQIDMGTAITADTLSCLVRAASITANEYAKKLTLVTSDDGTTWSSAKVAETNWIPTGGVFTDFFFTATTARYWRLFCEDRPSGYPAVNEVKLSLSTGYRYDDVTKDYTVSRDEMDVTDTSIFTLTKKSTGTDTVIVTYL